MTMEPSGTGRLIVSLAVLGLLAVAVWFTMEPGKFQYFTWLLLGFFAFRVLLQRLRARYSESSTAARLEEEPAAGQEG